MDEMRDKVEAGDHAVVEVPVTATKSAPSLTPAIAPRPHWITILLGLLSPLLATFAVTVSILGYRISSRSLETSQKSLAVGQRAYVSIKNGRYDERSSQASKPPYLAPMVFSFELFNSGNTPARVDAITLEFSILPGWRDTADQPFAGANGETVTLTLPDKPQVEAHSSVIVSGEDIFNLTEEAWQHARSTITLTRSGTLGHVKLHGRVRYQDVFENYHVAEWCWYPSSQYAVDSDCGK
jgi:hypothetical protein